MQETLVQFLGQEDPLEKGWATHSRFWGFPCGSAGKESACNVGDMGPIPELGRSPGEGKDYPLQYSGLENSMESQRVRHKWATFTFHLGFLTARFPQKCSRPLVYLVLVSSNVSNIVKDLIQTRFSNPTFCSSTSLPFLQLSDGSLQAIWNNSLGCLPAPFFLFFSKNYLLIYFWLCWVFIAVRAFLQL